MARKIFLTVSLIVLALAASFLVWRYIGYTRDKDHDKTFLLPRMELSEIQISSLTYEKTEMTIKTLIRNQLPISFSADSLQYRFFINDQEVIKDHYTKSITLKGNDSSWILLPVTIFNDRLVSILKAGEREHIDSVDYRVQVSFYTRIILKKHFNIDIVRKLPLVHIPEVKVEYFRISSLDFQAAFIQLGITLNNPNVFHIKARDVAYELSIENSNWIKSVVPGLIDIPPEGMSHLTVPVKLNFKEVGNVLLDMLRKSNPIDYKLHISFRIADQNSVISNSKIILESEGSAKSLIKISKKMRAAKRENE